MKTLATVNVIAFAIISAIAIYLGLDPKKWRTWLLSVYSFLTFFLVGFIGSGNFTDALKIGASVTFAIVFGGIITFWSRERAKKWLQAREKEEEESYRRLS